MGKKKKEKTNSCRYIYRLGCIKKAGQSCDQEYVMNQGDKYTR
jgi:hypothetical protein